MTTMSDALEPPSECSTDDAWYYHDERDHAWHTDRRYDECAECAADHE